jgi:hypothetical protein
MRARLRERIPWIPNRVRRDEKYAGDGRGVAEATHLRLAEWPHGGSHLGAFLASSFHRASRSPCVHTNRPQPTTSRPSATRHLTGHTKSTLVLNYRLCSAWGHGWAWVRRHILVHPFVLAGLRWSVDCVRRLRAKPVTLDTVLSEH